MLLTVKNTSFFKLSSLVPRVVSNCNQSCYYRIAVSPFTLVLILLVNYDLFGFVNVSLTFNSTENCFSPVESMKKTTFNGKPIQSYFLGSLSDSVESFDPI